MTYIKLKKKKIAIIGGGISGLSAAYLLSNDYDISLYESKSKLGGHAITLGKIMPDHNGKLKKFFFDIGFLVYNERNYPNFKKLLQRIKVKTEKSSMSFSVSSEESNFEYGSTGLLSITNNFKNIFRKDFWIMLFDIIKFYKLSKKYINNQSNHNLTLDSFLKKNKFSNIFIRKHIIPMCGAIWSTSSKEVLNMPTKYILVFLDNHGLLNISKRPKWLTISNGSINYVKKLEESIVGKIFKNEKVIYVERKRKKVFIQSKSFSKQYDKVIFAIHSDEILNILKQPNNEEIAVFSKCKYETNIILVHQDPKLMPKNKNVWSSWNVINGSSKSNIKNKICVTYWINKLQNLQTKYPILVTLNPPLEQKINKKRILKRLKLKHPLLEKNHLSICKKVNFLQGKNMTYYTGAWLGYGFHEDGLKASSSIVKLINLRKKND
ncbi:MAG: hypothetical protein CBC53_007735 [Alphaproteobacteria bacterium TMED93]|nr:MAG: hypothetical protein CBC53_007735 [Alphaproteobacteria bacterium TMED93]